MRGADRAARGQPHVRHEHVGAGLGHRDRGLDVEDVGRGQQVALGGQPDHVDLEVVAHAGLFEVLPEHAVEQADGREVLDAGEAHGLQLVEEPVHEPERVGAVDPGEDRRVATTGSTSRLISTTIWLASPYASRPGERAAPGHPVAAGVVDDDQVDAAGLGGLGRQAGSGARADDRLSRGDGGAQPCRARSRGPSQPSCACRR